MRPAGCLAPVALPGLALALVVLPDLAFVVEPVLAVELGFAPPLAPVGLAAGLDEPGDELPAGVDAFAEELSAGRAGRFWLRRCGRELGSPPRTSDDR